MTKRKLGVMKFETSRKAAIGKDSPKSGQDIVEVKVINLDRSNSDLVVSKLETNFSRKKIEEMLRDGLIGSTELPPGHI